MSDVRRVATVHAGAGEQVRNELLGYIEQALLAAGASRVWIDPGVRPDLAVMADMTVVPTMADLPAVVALD